MIELMFWIGCGMFGATSMEPRDRVKWWSLVFMGPVSAILALVLEYRKMERKKDD
jgi:hypothetical protein